MADRTVTVRLRADISQYTRSIRTAASNTNILAGAGAAASAVLVAGFIAAVSAAAKFDKALSNVRAVSGASSKEMTALRNAALDAGKATSFTASQAADAEAELARAGVSVANITGGALKGSLALAASGQIDLSESATIAAQAMNTFGLAGKDVGHIADVLSAGANKSASDVHGLGESLRMGGLLAHQTGLSLEDTVGVLSAFADHALIGSDAGTSLKTMLQRLTPQSAEAQAMMDKLGFSAYDSSGKFVGLTELSGRLQKSFSNLTPEARNSAMGVIFGSDAVRAATVLYGLGAGGINKYVSEVNDAGAAQRMAAIQTDNLSGDMERLRGSIEVALIQGGSAATGALRDMVQWITKLVNAYANLPPGAQKAVTVFAGVAGAAGLIASSMVILLPRIAATRTALTGLGLTAARTRTMMTGLGRATVVLGVLTAITLATNKLTDAMKKPGPDVAKTTAALVDLAQSGKKTGDSVVELDDFGDAVARIAHPSTLNRLTDVGSSLTSFGSSKIASLTEAKDKVNALDESLTNLVTSGSPDVAAQAFQKMAVEANKSGTSTDKLRGMLPKYADALAGVDTQQKLATGSQKSLGDQSLTTADDLADTRTEVQKLTDALDTLNGANIDVASSEIAYRQSLADMKQAVKDNGHSLDITTDKGRKMKTAFLDAAQAATKHAEAVSTQKNSVEAGDKVFAADIAMLKKQMEQEGFSKAAVEKLIETYARVPSQVATRVTTREEDAIAGLQKVEKAIEHVPAGKKVTMSAPTADAIQALKQLGLKVAVLKGKKISVTVPTSGAKAAVAAIQNYLNTLQDKHITLTTENRTIYTGKGGRGANAQADGSVLSFFAGGGMNENHVAQIAPAGSWRVWAEDETGGEAYIPLAGSKRGRSRKIAEETVRRLGGKGVAWYADGGIQRFAGGGFTYSPTGSPSTLTGPDNATVRYTQSVQRLADAWARLNAALADQKKKTLAVSDAEKNLAAVRKGHHTVKQLADAERKLRDARTASAKANSTVKADRKAVNAADAYLGVAAGAKAPTSFNLAAYSKQLSLAAAANSRWEANLASIGKKAGGDVEQTLRDMGKDGEDLVAALATASGKTFNDIVANLKKLAPTAKATLADYTAQLKAATTTSKSFQDNLLKLASMGYGDLATQLAAQGDDNAAAIAAAAVKSPSGAAAAEAAAKGNAGLLSGDDLSNALTLISVLRSKPGSGIADVIAAGLSWATISALVPKIGAQLGALPPADTATFLKQVAGQTGVTAMARGGILSRPTMVLGGEAGSRESWIPWNGSARSSALLARTAAGMGYQLVPAGRYSGGATSAGQATTDARKHIEVHLHAAKQTAGEQAADIARQLAFIG